MNPAIYVAIGNVLAITTWITLLWWSGRPARRL